MPTISTTGLMVEQFLMLDEDPPGVRSVKIDRKDNFSQYHKAGIRFYSIVDPQLKCIEGWELKKSALCFDQLREGAAVIGLAPFDDLQIPLSLLWLGRPRHR